MSYGLGHLRDELDRSSSGADDGHPHVGEVDVVLGPVRRVERQALEVVDTINLGQDGHRKWTDSGDQELGTGSEPVLGLDIPACRCGVVSGRGYSALETHIAAQIELVGHELQVAEILRLGREPLLPIPLGQNLG